MIATFHKGQPRSVSQTLLVCGAVGFAVIGSLTDVGQSAGDYIPQCPIHAFTGFHCPGCGTWRALCAMSQANLAQAAAFNPLLLFAIPCLLVYLVGRRAIHARLSCVRAVGGQLCLSRIVLLVVIAYSVLRNIPLFPFSLLAPGGPQ